MESRFLACVGAALLSGAALATPPLPPLPDVNVRIVGVAPPPPRPVVRVERPGPDTVWVDGYWDWGGSDWVWVDGRWERPPLTGTQWVSPAYERAGNQWRYVPAHWSNQKVVAARVASGRHDRGLHKGWYKTKKVKVKVKGPKH